MRDSEIDTMWMKCPQNAVGESISIQFDLCNSLLSKRDDYAVLGCLMSSLW